MLERKARSWPDSNGQSSYSLANWAMVDAHDWLNLVVLSYSFSAYGEHHAGSIGIVISAYGCRNSVRPSCWVRTSEVVEKNNEWSAGH